VTEEKLINELTQRTGKLCKNKIVLAIQDTSEINLTSHRNRLKSNTGLGRLDDAKGNIGFKLHPTLAVDAHTLNPLGFATLQLWHRPLDMPDRHTRKHKTLTIENKESYKWIRASNTSKDILHDAKQVIIIQDREGDIYDQLSTVPDEKHHLLIRSRCNRHLTDGSLLWDTLSKREAQGTYSIKIEGDKRKQINRRRATIEIRYLQTTVKRSASALGNKVPETILYAVEAKEINSKESNPIQWRLITTYPVTSFEDACLIVEWYSCRWLIEQIFRLLKHKGFNIEASELEEGWAIRKLCVLTLSSILKIIQMRLAYEEEGDGQNIDEVFTQTEQQCLTDLNKKLSGKTKKQSNPFKKKQLKWASWIISRLGGWKGYASQRCAGLITIRNGLEKFYLIYEGWMIAKDVGTR
jgi:Transposase DDE domain